MIRIVVCAKCQASWETVSESLGHECFNEPPAVITPASGLLNAMIANFASFGTWRDSLQARAEHSGRFDTLLHAVTVLHPEWDETKAQEWLIERVNDVRAAMAG